MSLISCKIENCDKPIRIKKLGMCQMHETRWRNYGDPSYKTKSTIIPLKIPGSEIVTNYQKAKKILAVVKTLEKMILCGSVMTKYKLESEAFRLINTKNNRLFYQTYVEPLLIRKECWKLLEYAGSILEVVDKIIDDGKYPVSEILQFANLNLDNMGIIIENGYYVFKESIKEIVQKIVNMDLDPDNMEDFELCYLVQMHQRRYDRINSKS